MDADRQALVTQRLTQAADSLAEAAILLQAGCSPRSVANRGYYAMFYAALALAESRGLATTKHSGVIALFDREFVKPGLFPVELSRALRAAFALRQEADYDAFSQVSQDDAEQTLNAGRDFVAAVEAWVTTQVG